MSDWNAGAGDGGVMSGRNAGAGEGGVTSACGGGALGGSEKVMMTEGGDDCSGSSLAPQASGASTSATGAVTGSGIAGRGGGSGCGSPSSSSRFGSGIPSARIGPRSPSDQSPASGSTGGGAFPSTGKGVVGRCSWASDMAAGSAKVRAGYQTAGGNSARSGDKIG